MFEARILLSLKLSDDGVVRFLKLLFRTLSIIHLQNHYISETGSTIF
jgi:hypothetical protein